MSLLAKQAPPGPIRAMREGFVLVVLISLVTGCATGRYVNLRMWEEYQSSGDSRLASGDAWGAARLYRQALGEARAADGESLAAAISSGALARALAQAGDAREAENLTAGALSIAERYGRSISGKSEILKRIIGQLRLQLADLRRQRGNLASSRTLYESAISTYETLLTSSPGSESNWLLAAFWARAMAGMAITAGAMGESESAEKLFQEVMDSHYWTCLTVCQRTEISKEYLRLLQSLGKSAESKRVMAAISRQSPDVELQQEWHQLYQSALDNRAEDRKEKLRKFMAAAKLAKNFKQPDRRLGITLTRAADELSHLGRLEESERTGLEALRILEASEGANSFETARACGVLGANFRKRAQLDRAREYFRRCVQIHKRLFENDPDERTFLSWSLASLASIIREEGKPEEARKLLEDQMAYLKQSRCPEDFSCLLILADLSCPKDPGKTGEILRWMLSRTRDHSEVNLVDLAGREGLSLSFASAVESYARAGGSPEAFGLAAEWHRLCAEKVGGAHPSTVIAYNQTGNLERLGGNLDKAEVIHRAAAGQATTCLSQAVTATSLAQLCLVKGSLREARRWIDQALKSWTYCDHRFERRAAESLKDEIYRRLKP